MTIIKCYPPRNVPASDMETIGKLYPYGIWSYGDLNAEACKLLAREFGHFHPNTEIIGISNHNGRGFQWGIILARQPGHVDWALIAQFGHGVRIPCTHWTLDWQRFWPLRLAVMRHSRWVNYKNHSVQNPKILARLV